MSVITDDAVIHLAIDLATKYHAGQLDKSGRPYLGHLERVAGMVRHSGGNWVQESAAWLHDIVEDTTAEINTLNTAGVPNIVVGVVSALTHWNMKPNYEYWAAIKAEPLAVLVKLCDIYDNLDPSRLCYLPPEDQTRLRKKYAAAIQAIC